MDEKAKAALALRVVEEIKRGCAGGSEGKPPASDGSRDDELHVLSLAVSLLLGPIWRVHNVGF